MSLPETDGKLPRNSILKERREGLFSQLQHVIGLSREKMDAKTTLNDGKAKWCRIMVSAVEAYGRMLEACQLEELEHRIDELELRR